MSDTEFGQWVQETDADELEQTESLEWWTYRTGAYADGQYEAIVARYVWAPNTYHLTVFRDEHGPLVEQTDVGADLDEAKESGTETISEAIDGF